MALEMMLQYSLLLKSLGLRRGFKNPLEEVGTHNSQQGELVSLCFYNSHAMKHGRKGGPWGNGLGSSLCHLKTFLKSLQCAIQPFTQWFWLAFIGRKTFTGRWSLMSNMISSMLG